MSELLKQVQAFADQAIASDPRLSQLTDQGVVENLILPYFLTAKPSPGPRHMVDVGAAYGSVSTVFLRAGWTADMLEPDPECQKVLVRLAAGFPGRCRVFPFAAGVENRDGVPFHQNFIPGLSGFAASPFGSSRDVLQVRSVRLGEFLPSIGVTRLDFLKIDTEGSDFEVLGTHDFARLSPALVFAEYSYHFPGHGPEEVRAAVAAMAVQGYAAVIFDCDDDGNFRKGNWNHRLVAMHFTADRVPTRPQSFGNVLFYRHDDTHLIDTVARLFRMQSPIPQQ